MPLFVTKPRSTEAVEGDTVIILCEVVGDPKPEVMWLKVRSIHFGKCAWTRKTAHTCVCVCVCVIHYVRFLLFYGNSSVLAEQQISLCHCCRFILLITLWGRDAACWQRYIILSDQFLLPLAWGSHIWLTWPTEPTTSFTRPGFEPAGNNEV